MAANPHPRSLGRRDLTKGKQSIFEEKKNKKKKKDRRAKENAKTLSRASLELHNSELPKLKN